MRQEGVALAAAGSDAAIGALEVTKRFPGVLANDRVTFEARSGEIHALLGENGSGKTTLCKVLTGLYRPDHGQVIFDGRPVALKSPADAHEAGVFMVHQHFSLVARLTVAENVVLGWSGAGGLRFSRREVADSVEAAAARFGIHVDPRAFVWQLSVGERQRVEILKALFRGARTLILDEPTTVLTPGETETLFASLRRMAQEGGTVVFISHKLRELFAVADRVTVLRHGRNAGTVELDGGADEATLARMMVDRDVQLERRVGRAGARSGAPVLRVRDVTAKGDFGVLALRDVSLEVRAGEIVGVAGVAGNGQRVLAEVIAGVRRRSGGSVSLGGAELPNGDPRTAIARGVAYVPEDRFGTGLAPGLDVRDNMVLKSYRTPGYSRGPFVRSRSALTTSYELLKRFDVKGAPHTLVRQLSGGNAQKVLLARELSSGPTLLVIAEPSAGLDIAATQAIRRQIAEAAEAGVAVLLISGDLEEILTLADRIAVMYGGSIVGVLDAATADVAHVGRLMAGVLP